MRPTTSIDELDIRRRRAVYRASHRGTKEMDWLLGRFAEVRLAGMSAEALASFERLLAMPDPEVHQWILEPAVAHMSEFVGLIADLRRFHGLDAAKSRDTSMA